MPSTPATFGAFYLPLFLDRLADFGFNVQLKFTEIIEQPVELVRVVRGGPLTPMMRVTVDDQWMSRSLEPEMWEED